MHEGWRGRCSAANSDWQNENHSPMADTSLPMHDLPRCCHALGFFSPATPPPEILLSSGPSGDNYRYLLYFRYLEYIPTTTPPNTTVLL